MEEKERYELFGEFGIIHDTSPNAECMLLNKFQTCEILNRQDKRIKELEAENKNLNKQLSLTEKAYKIAIFELDFARHHSQSTSQETVDRIEKLESEIWNKAKEKMKSE